MSPDEALAAAGTGDCFVVFHGDTGEVLAVRPTRPTLGSMTDELFDMKRAVPTVGRFFSAGALTRAVLEEQAADCRRIGARGQQIPDLESKPASHLVEVLEGCAPLPSALELPDDARWIIEAIFELHRAELTPDLIARLSQLRHRYPRCARALDVYLADVAGDRDALWRIWPGHASVDFSVLPQLLEAYGRLGESSQDYVDALLALIGCDVPFGGWFPAVTALGRVGPAAGQRAAEKILAAVHDTEPSIIELRDRVLARLQSGTAWLPCDCRDGHVVERSEARLRRTECPRCLGLTVVPG